jgi:hypothetical protein
MDRRAGADTKDSKNIRHTLSTCCRRLEFDFGIILEVSSKNTSSFPGGQCAEPSTGCNLNQGRH